MEQLCMNRKLILFDLDGTLIDSLEDIANAINMTRRDAGLSALDLEAVRLAVGNGADLLIDRTIPEEAMPHDQALAAFKKHYTANSSVKTKLYPGVKEGLEKLKNSGFILGVVSNKPSCACKKILDGYGISCFLEVITGGDSPYPLKPEPDALLAVKEQYSAEVCIMCGDHYTDLEAGRRAGFTTILAEYGFGDPRNETPDIRVSSFSGVIDFCRQL